jgi:chromate transporter
MRQPENRQPGSAATPGLLDLFLGFSGIAIIGFGGVLPWARRMLVERRRWLSADEFAVLPSLCRVFLAAGAALGIAGLV